MPNRATIYEGDIYMDYAYEGSAFCVKRYILDTSMQVTTNISNNPCYLIKAFAPSNVSINSLYGTASLHQRKRKHYSNT